MGTSSSYSGPSNGSPLLPPWADISQDLPSPGDPMPGDADQPEEADKQPEPPAESAGSQVESQEPVKTNNAWAAAKSAMTRFVSSGGRASNKGKAARAYVHAKGGSRTAARAAISGRKTAQKLGGFLSSLSTGGYNAALATIGLSELLGKSPEQAIAHIADKLAPSGSHMEDAAARTALLDALAFFYDDILNGDQDISTLAVINQNDCEKIFKKYVKEYISERWLQELGLRIESNAISPDEALKLEKEVIDYVEAAVDLDFSSNGITGIDWESAEDITQKIFEEAYSMLEANE